MASNRWADILRVLGRSLDAEDAKDVKIQGGDALEVAWQRAGKARGSSYGQLDMDKLREQAPLMRRPVSTPPKTDREELMRTLGQELDAQNVKIVEVVERPGHYE